MGSSWLRSTRDGERRPRVCSWTGPPGDSDAHSGFRALGIDQGKETPAHRGQRRIAMRVLRPVRLRKGREVSGASHRGGGFDFQWIEDGDKSWQRECRSLLTEVVFQFASSGNCLLSLWGKLLWAPLPSGVSPSRPRWALHQLTQKSHSLSTEASVALFLLS